MTTRLGRLAIIVALLTGGCSADGRVVVGAGTTIVDSGFASELRGHFAGDLAIIGASTAEILTLADQGSVDVAVVHDPAQELAFMESHAQAERRPVFTSRFLIVGPPARVGELAGFTPAETFAAIAGSATFVSRDDGSGTHARELQLWDAAGVDPVGDWYSVTGQGMGFTLQVADQRGAFTLVEEGAFLAAEATLDLVPVLVAESGELSNPYSVILAHEPGRAFYDWLTGAAGRDAIRSANERIYGRVVYAPSGDGE